METKTSEKAGTETLFDRIVETAKQAKADNAPPIKSFCELQFELFGLCTGIYCQREGIDNHNWDYDILCEFILSLFARTWE